MSLIIQSEVNSILDSALKEKGRLRKGNNLKYHCPFCHHRKRKMEVCLDNHVWHCWACDKKGRSVYGLLKRMRASDSLIIRLRKVVPIENSEEPSKISSSNEKKVVELPKEFVSMLDTTSKSVGLNIAKRYLKTRGISKWDIIKHNIGFCASGEYENRIIIPSYNSDNQLNFFTGRSVSDNVGLKYKNPDVDRNIVGFENLINFSFPVSLCEGPMDAVSIKRNAIPLFGKFLSPKLKQILSSNLVQEVFIVLDDDAIDSAISMADFLLTFGKIVRLVDLSGKDPNFLGFVETNRQIRETTSLDFSRLMKLKLNL